MRNCGCDDPKPEIRKFRTGARHGLHSFKWQCVNCRKKLNQRGLDPLNLPDGLDPREVEWGLDPLPKNRESSIKRRRKAKENSKERKLQNQRVMQRDNYECQGCGERATQVHHTYYGETPEEDLPDSAFQAACGGCNMAE